MRISKQQLQDVIDEEVEHALRKASSRRIVDTILNERRVINVYHVSMVDLIGFAKVYSKLNVKLREQLDVALEAKDIDAVRPELFMELKKTLGGINGELDMVIDENLKR